MKKKLTFRKMMGGGWIRERLREGDEDDRFIRTDEALARWVGVALALDYAVELVS